MSVIVLYCFGDVFMLLLSDKFSFGLWMVGWVVNDLFGLFMCLLLDLVEFVYRFVEFGVWGVMFYDDDLILFGIDVVECDWLIVRFKVVFDEIGFVVLMVMINFFLYLVFKDGGFMFNNRFVCCFVLCKVMRNIDLVVEFGV